MIIHLREICKSQTSRYKYKAVFVINNKQTKVTHFGANGYSDYTLHKNKKRRMSYIRRHWKDLQTNDPTRAGYLSMFILWNKPTLKQSITDYKQRLQHYNKHGVFPTSI
jgi:hypothetical protein